MNWQYALFTLLLFVTALLSTWLALFGWQRRGASWTHPFSALMIAVAIWSLGYALELNSPVLEIKLFWRKIQYVGIVITPVAWILFAQSYSGRLYWLRATSVGLLSAIPVGTLILVATNWLHELFWDRLFVEQVGPFAQLAPEYGPWFAIHALYTFLLFFGGALVLFAALQRLDGILLQRRLALLFSPFLPVFASLIYIFEERIFTSLNLIPSSLVLAGIILAWGVLRHQTFDLVPVARKTVIDGMNDGVVVVNAQNLIAEVNPAAVAMLGRKVHELIGKSLGDVMPQWSDLWDKTGEPLKMKTEVGMGERYYELHLSSLQGERDRPGGSLLVFHDVTQRKLAESELNRRKQLFENLVAVARATAEGPSLQGTLQNALTVTTALTNAEYGSLFLLDEERRVTDSILARGSTAPGQRERIVGSVMDRGLAGWVVRNREAALVDDTAEDARWLTLPDQPYAVRSVLAVPIVSGPGVPGVLTLQHSEPHYFSEADVELLRSASDQMALALRNAQIYENQRRLAERQMTMYEALRSIGSHLEPETVIKVAAETVASLTGWPAVAILVPNGSDDSLVVEAAAGLLAGAEGGTLSSEEGYSTVAFRTGETQLVADLEGNHRNPSSIHVPGLRSGIYVPLTHRQRRLGVFAVEHDKVDRLTEDDIWLAESLAEAIALAMANAALFEDVVEEHTRLQALIEASRDGIILVGVNRRILVINRPALNFIGLDGAPQDWVQRTVGDVLANLRRHAPDLVRAALNEVRRVKSGMETAGEGEVTVGMRTLQWVSLPVTAATSALGRLIVIQDVTRERMLQRMRDDLTHTMVHDLRNPLNVVSSALIMIEDRLGERGAADVMQMLEIAGQSTDRILNLVNGILSISRLESGQVPILKKPLDLSQLVGDAIDSQQPLAAEKGLKLSRRFASELPQISADADLLERVLQNLIGNAIKFTPAGGDIVVRLERGDDYLTTAVEDSGPGVSPAIRDQLFQKFVRGKDPGRGSGLGLAFCRMAIEAHGGRIWLDSDPGEGATFTFILPLGEDKDLSEQNPAREVEERITLT